VATEAEALEVGEVIGSFWSRDDVVDVGGWLDAVAYVLAAPACATADGVTLEDGGSWSS
jgi:hypothetical protein